MIIQIFDEADNLVAEFDYYDTILCEGQLTDEEEDIIEHLEVGDSAALPCGSVKRIS